MDDDGVLKCTQLIVETSLSLEMAFSEIVVDACFAIPWNPGKTQTAWSGHNHVVCVMCYKKHGCSYGLCKSVI